MSLRRLVRFRPGGFVVLAGFCRGDGILSICGEDGSHGGIPGVAGGGCL